MAENKYCAQVVKWKKVSEEHPGYLSFVTIEDILATNNIPEIIPGKFYDKSLFERFKAAHTELRWFTAIFPGFITFNADSNSSVTIFNSKESLVEYNEMKTSLDLWATFVETRDKFCELLGAEFETLEPIDLVCEESALTEEINKLLAK